MNTFGVYNIETKEFFPFVEYEDAYNGYLAILGDAIRESHLLPKDWYLVYIDENGKFVQFEQFNWTTHSIPPTSLEDLEQYTSQW